MGVYNKPLSLTSVFAAPKIASKAERERASGPQAAAGRASDDGAARRSPDPLPPKASAMNALIFTRVAFIACATFAGYRLGTQGGAHVESAMVGFVLSLLFVLLELGTDILPAKKIFLSAIGLTFGLALGLLVSKTIPSNFLEPEHARIVSCLIMGYFGVVFALKNADQIDFSGLTFMGHNFESNAVILDTSVIIDGRIRDLIMTHFIRGAIVVPSFVIYELQALADSRDSRKRSRGRRGLETLEVIKTFDAKLTIYEQDYPGISDVDLKLIQLAKDIDGELLTTDFNLYKIALLHQVRAMNVNELANVLKPVAYIGETINVLVTKEGKEAGQGVAYLDDGTMVVVDGGVRHMHKDVSCVITQILQTTAGRMVFARPVEEPSDDAAGGDDADSGEVGANSNSRPGRRTPAESSRAPASSR